ncbi:hypothetical protein KVR01_007580 [Diaporthe batatas]|uniref:uncharacterized protein n=1 Tax=Diaporthe batatas TaxID=748121 RepID=UPI001D044552|nr:uncharacterized protein KVR01_007580 [Diaporthe batatas]KAG8163102.1 hypothetical protein KVR01_007580 [Diaporthe batatas]
MLFSFGTRGSHNNLNIGSASWTLSDLLDSVARCDRLMMRQIEAWVKMMTDYIRDMAGWSNQCRREVVVSPNAGFLAQHKERVSWMFACDQSRASRSIEWRINWAMPQMTLALVQAHSERDYAVTKFNMPPFMAYQSQMAIRFGSAGRGSGRQVRTFGE